MLSYNHVVSVELADVETEPVTLQEVKDFAKIDEPDDDDLIEDTLIPAARALCEDYTGISFVSREINAVVSNGNGGAYLPYGPVTDVEEIDDLEPKEDQLTESVWKQINYPTCKVKLKYTGGYETLPAELKTALLNAVYFLYDNRSESGLSPTSKTILNKYRRV